MKKYYILTLAISLFTCSQAMGNLSAPQNVIEKPVTTTREITQNTIPNGEIQSSLTDEFIANLRDCKPYEEKASFNLMGAKISYKIKIDGWVNDFCTYHLSGKINSLGKDLKSSWGIKIKDSEISKIEPQIKCDFNKEQLNSVVDAIIEEDKQNIDQINKMMNDPQATYTIPDFNQLSPAEKKLMEIITVDKACTIVNSQELMQQITQLGTETQKSK